MDGIDNSERSSGREGGERKRGFLSRIEGGIRSSVEKRRHSGAAAIIDLLTFVVGLLFARCHFLFGAHPLAIAFISVLPSRVWVAAAGAVVGGITLGRSGVIYSMISVIVVFLRIIVSGTDKSEERVHVLFGESLLLRMSAATIGGFIAAIYEIMLSGFTMAGVLFGLSMILLPPVAAFALSGLFDTQIGIERLIRGTSPLFSRPISDKERYSMLFYQISASLFIFLISISLKEYSFLGISLSYVFATFATLLVSRRFGALRGAAVGFAASFGISGEVSMAFALGGLLSGLLFKLGLLYAIGAAGAVACLWAAYTGGVSGFLALLPEVALGTTLAFPLLKHLSPEHTKEEAIGEAKAAGEMVGTMALAYKGKYSGSLDSLESSLLGISGVIRRYSEEAARPTREELEELIERCICHYCEGCTDTVCGRTPPDAEKIERLAEIAHRDGRVDRELLSSLRGECFGEEGLAESINRALAILRNEKHLSHARDEGAEICDLVARLIAEARAADDSERRCDEELSAKLSEALFEYGIGDGVIRAFGKRKRHFILAAEDERGEKITSPALRSAIERISSTALGTPEYYRRGNMALMEVTATARYGAECATASVAGGNDEVSGDTARAFETSDGRFYALISDGMGRGAEAKDSSLFCADFLSRALDSGVRGETVLRMLNRMVKHRTEECSATVDLFSLDLYTGETCFLKCGAAPSFVKRGSGIYRIKSRTAPLGLLKEADVERIRVESEGDDYIVMLSDGVCQGIEESTWLIELLSKTPKRNLKEYAEEILSCAIRRCTVKDDMTVSVIRLYKR